MLKKLLTAVSLTVPLAVFAIDSPQVSIENDFIETPIEEQRKLFLKAEGLVFNTKGKAYRSLANQLQDYPLYPYLEQKALLRKTYLSQEKHIAEFLDTYKGQPVTRSVREKWLKHLAKNGKHKRFLSYYQSMGNAKLDCYRLRFKLKQGASVRQIDDDIAKMWIVGKSQNKVCDPVFKQWRKAGLLTEERVWQRLALAATKGKHTLIPYLTSLLPENQQYLGRLWHKVRRDPTQVSKLSAFSKGTEREKQILVYGLKRLIWRKPELALRTWGKVEQKIALSPDQVSQVAQSFALALSSKGHKRAKDWLFRVPQESLSEQLVQWRMADSLRTQDWQESLSRIQGLPSIYQKKPAWQYWLGRALEETEQAQDASGVMGKLAQTRHYYGFLASGKLDQLPRFQHTPVSPSADQLARMLKHSTLLRARELYKLGRLTQARREWRYLESVLDSSDRLAAAKLASDWGWYDRAIFALAKNNYLDDIELRFPLAFAEPLNKYSKINNIEPAWAFAITRRESSFMADANSSAGAKGLMQLMPRTAKLLSKNKMTRRQLLNPTNNIKYGTRYLGMLLNKNEGNQVLATAAYNAGHYRVKTWLPKKVSMPADIWIETIPYKETRDYVKAVLAYQQIYANRLGESSDLFSRLASMQITP